jgi:hypothetical protein
MNGAEGSYLELWDVDFTKHQNKLDFGERRDVDKEPRLESQMSDILRHDFSFRFVLFEGESRRMGSQGMESRLIGTLANCGACVTSRGWLGRHSPNPRITEGKLWLVQHLTSSGIEEDDKRMIDAAVASTKEWMDDPRSGYGSPKS